MEEPTPYSITRVQRSIKRQRLLYHYDAGAIMGFPRLHLLDQSGWAALLPDLPRDATALDIGAGSGHLLRDFAPLFPGGVVATELSAPLVWRLGQQGAHAFKTDVVSRETLGGWWNFDVAFVLNVIDRCKDPVALLRQVAASLRPGGTLVVAVPLPWEQHDARASLASQAELAVKGDTWEAAASHLLQLLSDLGLRPRRLVRAPYWCSGSEREPALALDGAIVLLDAGEAFSAPAASFDVASEPEQAHKVPLRTDDEYVQTPAGFRHVSCVFEWPSGTVIAESHAFLLNGTRVTIPPCNRSALSKQVPGEYGWAGYAAAVGYKPECPDSTSNTRCSSGSKRTGRGPVTQFTSEFDVPAKPGVDTERTATFIFNGLEGQGPDGGAWILQPVLQYCARVLTTPCQPTEKNQWQFRSYYCGPKTGPAQNCHCGPGIDVSPGQRLTGDMALLPDGDWQVLGAVTGSATQSSMLNVHGASDQVYANLALEIWFTKTCASYPGPIAFSVTKLVDSSGPLHPVWSTKYELSGSCVHQGTCDPTPPLCNPHISISQSALDVNVTSGTSCQSAMASVCTNARLAGPASCTLCTGSHQHTMMAAGCSQHDLDAFCEPPHQHSSYIVSGSPRGDGIYDQLGTVCNGKPAYQSATGDVLYQATGYNSWCVGGPHEASRCSHGGSCFLWSGPDTTLCPSAPSDCGASWELWDSSARAWQPATNARVRPH